jgi:hypothetical protein
MGQLTTKQIKITTSTTKNQKNMKKTLLTVALVTASLAAFAQGKVALQLDSGSAIALGTGGHYLAPDAALSGMAVPTTGPLPSGVVLDVGLYAGTSASSLTLCTGIAVLNPTGGTGNLPGVIPIVHENLPFAGGSMDYFQVVVWDGAYTSPAAAAAANSYDGVDNVFTMTPGTGIAYTVILGGGGTTWAAVGDETTGAGSALDSHWITPTPEPTTFALAGLGAAALVIFRRRNRK